MSQIDIRQVTAADHGAWLPLWQAYLKFYNTELPDAVSQNTWQRLIDASELTHSALAWQDGKAVGMVNFIYHRSNWSIENACYLQDATAKHDGCCKVHWLTHETNATAIQLYERIAERPGFIQFRKGL